MCNETKFKIFTGFSSALICQGDLHSNTTSPACDEVRNHWACTLELSQCDPKQQGICVANIF